MASNFVYSLNKRGAGWILLKSRLLKSLTIPFILYPPLPTLKPFCLLSLSEFFFSAYAGFQSLSHHDYLTSSSFQPSLYTYIWMNIQTALHTWSRISPNNQCSCSNWIIPFSPTGSSFVLFLCSISRVVVIWFKCTLYFTVQLCMSFFFLFYQWLFKYI